MTDKAYYQRVQKPKDQQFIKEHGISRSGANWRKMKAEVYALREKGVIQNSHVLNGKREL